MSFINWLKLEHDLGFTREEARLMLMEHGQLNNQKPLGEAKLAALGKWMQKNLKPVASMTPKPPEKAQEATEDIRMVDSEGTEDTGRL